MADDSTTFLQAEITRLHRELGEANADAKSRRIAGKKATADLDALKLAHAALMTDRDGWKAKASAAPGELQTKLDALEAKDLARDHRDAFEALRDDSDVGLSPAVKAETLMAALAYKPEGPVDSAKIKALVVEGLTAHPYFRSTGAMPTDAPGGATQGSGKPPLKVVTEPSRGGRDTAGIQVRIKKSDMQNPAFTLAPANKRLIADAQAAGTFQLIV